MAGCCGYRISFENCIIVCCCIKPRRGGMLVAAGETRRDVQNVFDG